MEYKQRLIQWFVNLYRQYNGNNAGLTTKDLNKMTIKELQRSIYGYTILLKI